MSVIRADGVTPVASYLQVTLVIRADGVTPVERSLSDVEDENAEHSDAGDTTSERGEVLTEELLLSTNRG